MVSRTAPLAIAGLARGLEFVGVSWVLENILYSLFRMQRALFFRNFSNDCSLFPFHSCLILFVSPHSNF